MGINASKNRTPPDLVSDPVSDRVPGTILGKPLEDINKLYRLGKQLGKSNIVYRCTEISTGNEYACKSISKTTLDRDEDKESLKNEIQMLSNFLGEPSIVQIKGSYEDSRSVHIVMELCDGYSLFDWIDERIDLEESCFSEEEAAPMMESILKAVQICHSKGVIHRNINPSNFLYSRVYMKAVGFRHAVYFKEGEPGCEHKPIFE